MAYPQRNQDSSALFTLNELMIIEEERLRQEEADKKRKAEAAQKAREEAEAQRLSEERARLEAEEARRAEQRRREAEERARLEGIRQAILAQQAAEQQRRAAAQEEAERHAHEQAMARIAQDGAARRLRRALVGISVAAAVICASGLGAYYGKIKPEQDRRAADVAAQLDEQRRAAASAQKEVEAAQARLSELERERDAARTEAERADIASRMADAKGKLQVAQKAAQPKGLAHPEPKIAKGGAPADCDKGDPMCGLNR